MTTVTAILRTKSKVKAPPKTTSGSALPLGKQLAHTDKKVRDAAFANVIDFLSNGGITQLLAPLEDAGGVIPRTAEEESQDIRRGQLPPLEMRRLWKGFWMSDKPLVQQRLASDLSSIILQINPRSTTDGEDEEEASLARDMAALDFIEGFWEAIIREWVGIDRFRMDKYYMLLRRWVNASFRLLARSQWNPIIVDRYNQILVDVTNGPLAWANPRTPASLGWHLADLWVEELDKVVGEIEDAQAPIPTLLQPFSQLLTRTNNPQTSSRLLHAVYVPILKASLPDADPQALNDRASKRRKTSSSSPEDARAKVRGILDGNDSAGDERLGRDVLGGLMKEAGLPDEQGVKDVNRRKVYAFVRDWGGADEEDESEDEDDE
ncbi:hypothetical protein QFC20_006832 [Naganishia adeliensis]|uniref:Uncharacterized protein n=1 Tax=Naganishia adeliensis TaxID=92952 RepID=A0ACC2V8C3_9TREE|nr:hypothetical protein QFC20_006832 [Naganishia adeliensis]